MSSLQFIQAQSFQLQASGASSGDTSITLQSFKQIDGVTNILTADLGDRCYATLEPNNGTQEEAIQFTGVTQNASGTATLTGVSSVGFVSPYSVTSGLSKSHAGGVTIILSNDAGFYGNIKTYIDTVVASGAAFANLTTAGISKLSVSPATGSNPIAAGANNTLSTSTLSSANTIVDQLSLSTTASSGAVVRARTDTGMIDSTFLNPAQVQIYSITGTILWTRPANAKTVYVTLIGGGGGGGGGGASNAGGGGGGGGGAISQMTFNATAISGNVIVTVGAGGASAAGGTDSTFGSFLTAKGGAPGITGGGSPGAGGNSGIGGSGGGAGGTNGISGFLGGGGGGSTTGAGGVGSPASTYFAAGGGGGAGLSGSVGAGGSAFAGTPATGIPIPGSGGAGATSGSGGSNANLYGSGGGGSGSSGSGLGGSGANGFAEVATYF